MGILQQNRRVVVSLALLLVALLIVGACSADPTAQLISPDMSFEIGEEAVVAVPTPTPEILDITTLTEDEIFAGLDEMTVAAIKAGDPDAGAQISQLNGCIGCHSLEKGGQLVGPSWYGAANHAIGRVEGESPAYYLYQSIVNSGAYVVPTYPSGVMPQNYGEILSSEDLGNLVAYLLTFQGQ